jgi:putative transposase
MSYTRLRYHIVFATKHRRPWISEDVEEFLYPTLIHSAQRYNGKAIAIGGIEDHVHLVVAARPDIAVSEFVERLKSESAAALKRHRRSCWHFAWGIGFGAFTLNPERLSGVIAYVRQQKEHHYQGDLWEEYERWDGNNAQPK